MILLKQIKLNEYTIKLEDSKQPPYWPIYNLELIKLEIRKMYIKVYLKTGFI